ncbi:hypothetical protein J2T09_004552 [Neorhizobium huautlense]|uniref:Uncharacterized protein n=1 Tax=Neorhizobium huautlense TaxID=67774 RepID=A0ABT9PZ91_9HYPH|nr:hypothetical protein [Neorhizobium huautlense]MDP9839772.1 hypothetical protein [Neorhizobium huautlense]
MKEAVKSELAVLLSRAGVPLRSEDMADIQHGWELLQPVLTRLRQEDCDFESEPAPIFRPDAFDPEI